MARITDQTGRPFGELFRMVECLLNMDSSKKGLLNLPPDEQDSMVIDSGYCLDRIHLNNHPYPRKRK